MKPDNSFPTISSEAVCSLLETPGMAGFHSTSSNVYLTTEGDIQVSLVCGWWGVSGWRFAIYKAEVVHIVCIIVNCKMPNKAKLFERWYAISYRRFATQAIYDQSDIIYITDSHEPSVAEAQWLTIS